MQLLVFTVIGLCAWVIAYSLGLGGTVGSLIFLVILLTGVFLRVSEPLMRMLRP